MIIVFKLEAVKNDIFEIYHFYKYKIENHFQNESYAIIISQKMDLSIVI